MDMLKKSLQATEDENKRLGIEKSEVEERMRVLDKAIMMIAQEIKRIEEDLLNKESD